jgi:hypothetical protein
MNLGCPKGRKREATCVLQNKTRGHHFGESSWKCVCFFNGRFSCVIFISYNPESVCSSSAESKGLSYYMYEFWMWFWLHIFIKILYLLFSYISIHIPIHTGYGCEDCRKTSAARDLKENEGMYFA